VQLQPGGGDNGARKGQLTWCAMKRLWTVTTPPALPGFQLLLAPGGRLPNPTTPRSRTYFGWGRETSACGGA